MLMPVLSDHRFSVEEYYRLVHTGSLKPDDRVELLEGKIFDMSPIGPAHASITRRLNQIFSAAAESRYLVSIQDPVRIAEDSELQPDLMLLKPHSENYDARHPSSSDVLLLIEVADTTLNFDRSFKLPAYARSGVVEVWIVNIPARAIEVCRGPRYTGYSSRTVLNPPDYASPQAFPDVSVPLATLFP